MRPDEFSPGSKVIVTIDAVFGGLTGGVVWLSKDGDKITLPAAKVHMRARGPKPALTKQQLELLDAISAGCTTEEIAHALGVGHSNVRTRVHRLLDKLGTRNRAHAVAIAFTHGLLPVRGDAR